MSPRTAVLSMVCMDEYYCNCIDFLAIGEHELLWFFVNRYERVHVDDWSTKFPINSHSIGHLMVSIYGRWAASFILQDGKLTSICRVYPVTIWIHLALWIETHLQSDCRFSCSGLFSLQGYRLVNISKTTSWIHRRLDI